MNKWGQIIWESNNYRILCKTIAADLPVAFLVGFLRIIQIAWFCAKIIQSTTEHTGSSLTKLKTSLKNSVILGRSEKIDVKFIQDSFA